MASLKSTKVMMPTTGSLKGIRSNKVIAILGSLAASITIGLTFLELDLKPPNIPEAMVASAVFLEPALLMILSSRGRALDLAAGITAALLGVGFFVYFPLLFLEPQFALVGLLCGVSATAALKHRSFDVRTKGDVRIALQAVVLVVLAFIVSGISDHPTCRASAIWTVCVDDATSYTGATAAILTLWVGSALVWLSARRPPAARALPARVR